MVDGVYEAMQEASNKQEQNSLESAEGDSIGKGVKVVVGKSVDAGSPRVCIALGRRRWRGEREDRVETFSFRSREYSDR